MIGKVVGFLTVIAESNERSSRGDRLWECQCSCGERLLVASPLLKKEEKKSCGCKTKSEVMGTHGFYGTRTYNSWRSMIDRCYLTKHESYIYYGGKGIIVCDEWRSSFENFLNDMGERPNGCTLDRINVDGNYCPENCRWVDASTQQQNKNPTYSNKNKGLAGVFYSRGKYCSRIRYDGKREYLGSFNTPEEANEAYNKRGREVFGEMWVDKFGEVG